MQDGELLQAISRLAESMAKGPVQRKHARRFDGDSQLAHQGKRDSGHAAGFDFTCEQSHGPRTDWSGRHEQGEINVGLRQQRANLVTWREQFVGIVGEAKTIVRFGNMAHDSLRF